MYTYQRESFFAISFIKVDINILFYLSAFKECTNLLLIMFLGNFFYVDSLVILNVGNINNIRNFIENKICYIIKHTCTIEYTYVLRNHVNMYTPFYML